MRRSLFNPKQKQWLKNTTKTKINIAWGSVRSGKSWINNMKILGFCEYGPPGDILITGRTERTIRRNIIDPMRNLIGSDLKYKSIGMGECHIGKRKCVIRSGNDNRSYEKIQGDSFCGVVVDELTILPESLWNMILTRMDVEGAQLFASTNPDSPFHWVKKNVLDGGGYNQYDLQFLLEDNPKLPDSYVQDMLNSTRGLFYDRYVLGLWVLADGVVYDSFNSDINIIDRKEANYKYQAIGVDYGITNPTVFLKIKWNNVHDIHVTDEYVYDYKDTNKQKTDGELADDMDKFVGQDRVEIFCDPSATSFITELRKRGRWVKNADNAVIDGIRYISGKLSEIKIHNSCENLIKEFSTYIWDAKAQLKGEDKPIKENDHALDALRYAIYTKFARGTPIIG